MAFSREKLIYWVANLAGWGGYFLLTALIMQGEGTLTPERTGALITAYPLSVLLSHLMRFVYIRWGCLRSSIASLIPKILLITVLFGVLFFFLHGMLLSGVYGVTEFPWRTSPFDIFQTVLNWSLLFFFWSAIYFAYHFFQDRRRQEIEALRWEARKSELELQQLRDQLDPHFMFNCLNSIKALIEENPDRAKQAIAQLSNSLRYGLTLSRRRTIPLREELKVIEDHLALEGLRLEERLKTRIDVAEELNEQPVPPFLVQSLVENGIKHGISKIPEGGTLDLQIRKEEGRCRILVSNPKPSEDEADKGRNAIQSTGTGLENARKRLHLLYGSSASLTRKEEGSSVRTFIELPLKYGPSNDHHR